MRVNKILDVLLFPLSELAGWLVMRDLRRWAASPHPLGEGGVE